MVGRGVVLLLHAYPYTALEIKSKVWEVGTPTLKYLSTGL